MMCQTVANLLFLFSPFLQRDNEDEELCSVFVPTNHLYIGDIFLVNSKDILRPNLSIREGIGMFYAFVNLWYRSFVTLCLFIDFLVGRGELICLIAYNDLHRYITLHLIYAWLSQGMGLIGKYPCHWQHTEGRNQEKKINGRTKAQYVLLLFS